MAYTEVREIGELSHNLHVWEYGRDAKEYDSEQTGHATLHEVQARENKRHAGEEIFAEQGMQNLKPMPERMTGMPMCHFLLQKQVMQDYTRCKPRRTQECWRGDSCGTGYAKLT